MRLWLATIFTFLVMANTVHAGLPDDLKAKVGGIAGQFVVDSRPLPYAIVSFFSAQNGLSPLKGKVQLFRIPDPVETRKKFEDEARAGDWGGGRQSNDKRQSVEQGKND